MKSGIYKIYFNGSDRFYVGSALNLVKRRENHLYFLRRQTHPNRFLLNLFNKYGRENFRFEVLERVAPDSLVEREQAWIDELRPELNILKIARSSFGFKHDEDTRMRMSRIKKEHMADPELRAKSQATQFKKGMEVSVERREQIRAQMLTANPFKGRTHTEEARRKMSEKAKAREERRRLIAAK
jgi:group I intron endonuclease